MNNMSKLPQPFLHARLKNIDDELEGLPYMSIGQHGGRTVIREYYTENGVSKRLEKSVKNPKGRYLLERFKRRELLMEEKRIIESLITGSSAAVIDPQKVKTIFNKELWDRMSSQTMDVDPDIVYVHNGIRMRSRGEVVIAQVLDSLGLEYKYEIRIMIDGDEYYPDFAVFLPVFQRFFFIEFLGKADDKKYMVRNGLKIGTYINAGMIINEDLLIFEGTSKSMPDVETITEDIVALISKYCRMYSR